MLSAAAAALLRELRQLPLNLLQPSRTPIRVDRRGHGTVRLSHVSGPIAGIDRSEAAFEELIASGSLRRVAGGPGEAYYVVEHPSAQSATPDLPKAPFMRRRPGPPLGSGTTVEEIDKALTGWSGAWPPTQEAVAHSLGISARQLSRVHNAAGMRWHDMVRRTNRT